MKIFYYDDINHSLKEIKAFSADDAIIQANNLWNIYSKAENVNSAVLYDENLEVVEGYNKNENGTL